MTITEILSLIEDTKPSQVSQTRMREWLSRLDQSIFKEIIKTHEADAAMPETFSGYTAATEGTTELLVPAPYDEIYRWYLEMQIDLMNMELEKYNNSAALYTSAYAAFSRFWNREHMPIPKGRVWNFG